MQFFLGFVSALILIQLIKWAKKGKLTKTIIETVRGPELVSAAYKRGTYHKDGVMTLTYDDKSIVEYWGDCTVWHYKPSGRRCQTHTESWLCDLWTRIRNEGSPIIF